MLAIAWIAAQAFWFAVYGTDALNLTLEASSFAASDTGRTMSRSRPSAGGLFASIDAPESAGEPAPPETRLNLELRGVRAGADPYSGAAVMESPGQGQRVLAAQSEIVAGVRLVEIHPDRVIINRRGVRETVYLREEGRRAIRAASAAAPALEAEAAAESQEAAVPPELSARDWIDGLSLEPFLAGGRMVGLRVRSASRADVLHASGLTEGDIIRAVNGTALDGLDAARRVAQVFDTAERIELQIERDGALVTLTVPHDQDG